MTEIILTPQEKRDGVIRDHVLYLLENLHDRLALVERELSLSERGARKFGNVLGAIRREETRCIPSRPSRRNRPVECRESGSLPGDVSDLAEDL